MDDDFGVVKEEIVEEDCPLPCFNGRVVSWLVSADGGSVLSDADTGSQCGQSDALSSLPPWRANCGTWGGWGCWVSGPDRLRGL